MTTQQNAVTAAAIIAARFARLRTARLSAPWTCRHCNHVGQVFVGIRSTLRDVETAIASQHAEADPTCSKVIRIPAVIG